ncbi:MAG: GAF domain-containing protein, partial [Bacteroidetes bacterium]|nr:GAF domain-containing protein [Bacteroidota bacterium]
MRCSCDEAAGHKAAGHKAAGHEAAGHKAAEQSGLARPSLREAGIEHLVASISSDLIDVTAENLNAKVDAALMQLGEFAGVDRSYVFILREENRVMDNTHEWCASGIEAQKQNLQDLSVTHFPWWMEKLHGDEHIYLEKVSSDLPPEAEAERAILEEQGVCSLLVVPISGGPELYGFMGFDSVRCEKSWTEHDIHLLHAVANAMASAIHAVRSRELLLQEKIRAVESDRLKSAFLSTMNHELRTPLNHIIGFSDIIREMDTDEEVRSYADIIHESGGHLLEIIEDIFDLAMVEQGGIALREQVLPLSQLLSENTGVLEELLHDAGKQDSIALHCDFEDRLLERCILTDRRRIGQVLNNLFRNAIKYTRTGHITFAVRAEEQTLLFSVSDTGVGITGDQQHFIFDPFRQGDDSYARHYHGLGIGLTIARRVAHAMNGDVRVESVPDKGSTFFFTLPVTWAEEATAQKQQEQHTRPDCSGKTILVVDDDAETVWLLRRYLMETQA